MAKNMTENKIKTKYIRYMFMVQDIDIDNNPSKNMDFSTRFWLYGELILNISFFEVLWRVDILCTVVLLNPTASLHYILSFKSMEKEKNQREI